ncbi:DUF4265 domain-containing protein [Hymenobacter cellulosilyticus]|uniref:DUF4265 domain-containing protein n=1 Tax=Hymenobacter cellulosilyticus TaxID=2932248 RepID=A0A8T9Q4V9_9BACT|nr:DUF4265 domain-containing protein [Hymenobacter cellulosilyticus]UOQ70830.1 DUF4265 domain-containing protein [Hymenobacter cellulosilyticus]
MISEQANYHMHNVALVYLEEIDKEYKVEMVDTVEVDEGYKLVSIPFFAKHLALHDIVTVENEDGVHYFDDIIVKSGHSVVRIVFFDKNLIENTINALQCLGANAYRYYDSELFALDIPASTDYSPIKQLLKNGSATKSWDYEEACLGWK